MKTMTSNSEKTILNSPALASEGDGNEYRFVLKINGEDKLKSTLHIERNFKKQGAWDGVPSGWYISSLLEHNTLTDKRSDQIFIDGGQNWYVTGLRDAIKEVLGIIAPNLGIDA